MNLVYRCSILILLFNFVLSNKDAMTCGSSFKLVNQQSGDRLHSHDVKYGSGSGQQVNRLIKIKQTNEFIYYLVSHWHAERR